MAGLEGVHCSNQDTLTGPGLEGVHCTNHDTLTGPKGGWIRENFSPLCYYLLQMYVTRLIPFYTSIGACLFTWNDGRVLTRGPFEFRVVDAPKMAPEAYSSYQVHVTCMSHTCTCMSHACHMHVTCMSHVHSHEDNVTRMILLT